MIKRENNTKHVRTVIEDLLKKFEESNYKKGNAIGEAWKNSVREEAKGHARPVSLKNGKLMVIVDNSTWLYELTLEKRTLMRKFNENYKGRKKIDDIRFRVGDVEA